ncbi:hypothetical protein A2U01_0062003, partial [Trifolium medium]|nr:hypothetical protein [Trifolium medium]
MKNFMVKELVNESGGWCMNVIQQWMPINILNKVAAIPILLMLLLERTFVFGQ